MATKPHGRKSQLALAGAPTAKGHKVKPVKVLPASIADMVDPEVRKVHAAKMQVHDMAVKLDTVLQMAWPEWDKDEHIYVAGEGFFKKKDAAKLTKPADPTSAPMRRYAKR